MKFPPRLWDFTQIVQMTDRLSITRDLQFASCKMTQVLCRVLAYNICVTY